MLLERELVLRGANANISDRSNMHFLYKVGYGGQDNITKPISLDCLSRN